MRKAISIIIVLALCLGMSTYAFAADKSDTDKTISVTISRRILDYPW